jgi:hypothetical protein
MKTPYFQWRDLAFGWREKRPSGAHFIYMVFSVRCAICGRMNWRNWRRYHEACRLQLEEVIQKSLEDEDLEEEEEELVEEP